MSMKMFSEDTRFIASTNYDVFAIKIRDDNESLNYILSDDEVRDLQTLCECHLRNKVNHND